MVHRLPLPVGACARVVDPADPKFRRVGRVADRVDLGRGRAVMVLSFGRGRGRSYHPDDIEAVRCPARFTRARDATPRVLPFQRRIP